MIESQGSIFDCGAQALVNPVNCVGVMGGGLAKAFAIEFPDMEEDYIRCCTKGLLEPGSLHTYYSNLRNQPMVINFPTKDDWIHPSEYEYITSGMKALITLVEKFTIRSVAIPALGCGLGGLRWDRVKSIIDLNISVCSETKWIVFPPR
jgi:O-acetyl-ADP-ribose deacetylase (regulator of RNase III)